MVKNTYVNRVFLRAIFSLHNSMDYTNFTNLKIVVIYMGVWWIFINIREYRFLLQNIIPVTRHLWQALGKRGKLGAENENVVFNLF